MGRGRRRSLSTPDRSRPHGRAQSPRLRLSLTIGSWYHISIIISRLPRVVALGRPRDKGVPVRRQLTRCSFWRYYGKA
eukprot:6204888-Pleurochrysis_carterae.AAC.3